MKGAVRSKVDAVPLMLVVDMSFDWHLNPFGRGGRSVTARHGALGSSGNAAVRAR
jgi:hypothetical protein